MTLSAKISTILILSLLPLSAYSQEEGSRPVSESATKLITPPPLAGIGDWGNTVSANYIFDAQDQPIMVENGDGFNGMSLEARSQLRLDSRSMTWGHASFTTGQKRNIRWCEAVDYDILGPYVLGDSVGGDMSMREYRFGGGYARQEGRWAWGAEVNYRASVDYRDRDPRAKINVSDLDITLGGNVALPVGWIGASGGLRVYNQVSDIDFYNPINNIRLYALTGLGTIYSRFSGNSNENTGYSGLGGQALLTFTPRGNGFSAQVGYNYLRIKQILRDFNNLTLCRTSTHTIGGIIKSPKILEGQSVSVDQVEVGATWRRRIGTENIYGSSLGTSYNLIADRTPYYADDLSLHITLPLPSYHQTRSGDASPAPHSIAFQWSLSGRYTSRDEHHSAPQRQLKSDRLTMGLNAALHIPLPKQWGLMLNGAGAKGWGHKAKMNLDGLDTQSSLGQAVVHDFEMLTLNTAAWNAGFTLSSLPFSGCRLHLSCNYQNVYYQSHGHCQHLIASVALTF
ncbi:MAG: hypothetical protein LIP02_01175 [Bacteroidales bacterium]|nr:hypothetical protein [Bacteroidales bacterium]